METVKDDVSTMGTLWCRLPLKDHAASQIFTYDLTYVVALLKVPLPTSSVCGNPVEIFEFEMLLSSEDSHTLRNQRIGTPAILRRFAVAIDTAVCHLQDRLGALPSKNQ